MATVAQLPTPTIVHKIDARDLVQADEVPTGSELPRLRIITVCKDPEISIIPNFLSPAEARHLMDLAESHWIPSLIAGQASEDDASKEMLSNQRSRTRTSRSCMLRPVQTSIVEQIEHRCSAVAGLPVEHLERLTLVRYAPGEYFSEHHDGKFRPKTIFVYLNEIPDEDEGGGTVFSRLGICFRPRLGCAVMWRNATPCGQEDSRMLHEGQPPTLAVKYGVNCFFNDLPLRLLNYPEHGYHAEDVGLLDLATLAPAKPKRGRRRGRTKGEDNGGDPTLFVLKTSPKVAAVLGFLSAEEVDHILGHVETCSNGSSGSSSTDAYDQGSRTLRIFDHAETPVIKDVEARISAVSGHDIGYLAKLRTVQVGTALGLCNRGCGPKSGTICLSEHDEVFFPAIGLKVLLRRGDFVQWSNVDWQGDKPIEDMQTLRVHRPVEGEKPAIGLDIFFHDTPVREQQCKDIPAVAV
mmetsp:Transcript_48042/g.112236  ORF Transcript_48042/g.112236 Transcript_48042/m.112236 type:complete len:465 (-) Transcript_48042:52-1446(-)